MSSKLDAEQRAILAATLQFGEAAADIIDSAVEVLEDLNRYPIGTVHQCRASRCKAVRIRVLRGDVPTWKYVWPRKNIGVGENEQCPERGGFVHEFTVLKPSGLEW